MLRNQHLADQKNKVLDIAESYTNPDLARVFVFRELRWEKRLTAIPRRNPPNETRVGWGTRVSRRITHPVAPKAGATRVGTRQFPSAAEAGYFRPL